MRVNKSLITFQQTGAGTGSVTSVAMTVPTGLTISGSPITSSGTLALGFASGVALPPSQTGNAGKYLTTDGTNLSWGNISGSISGTANYVPFFATSSTLGTSPLYYDGSYYMAIGTTTTGTGRFLVYNNLADTHLQVSGTTPSIRITDTPTSATYNSVIGLAISSNSFITNTVAGDLAIANASGGSILFGIGSTEMMRIFTSTGNVNIGGSGTDTGDKLYVGGIIKGTGQLKLTGYTSTSSFTGTAAGYLAFDSSGNILSAAAPSGINIYNSDGTLTGNRTLSLSTYYLRIAGTSTTSFFSTGNVTIGGTTDAGYKLDVQGTIRANGRLTISTSGASIISSSTQYFEVFDQYGTRNFMTGGETSGGILVGNSSLGSGSGRYVSIVQASSQTNSYGGIRFYNNNAQTSQIGTLGIVNGRIIFQTSSTDISTQNALIADAYNLYLGYQTYNTLPASAALAIQSTTKGFLPPRMTNAERTAISSPAVGLIVYCTDSTEGLYVYKSGGWTFII